MDRVNLQAALCDPEGFPLVEHILQLHPVRQRKRDIEPGRNLRGVEKHHDRFASGLAEESQLLVTDI